MSASFFRTFARGTQSGHQLAVLYYIQADLMVNS